MLARGVRAWNRIDRIAMRSERQQPQRPATDPGPGDPATLRRGWTTGACAAAAAKAGFQALLTGAFPNTIAIRLPKGETPDFEVVRTAWTEPGGAVCGVIKDAGDDPDVTHGVELRCTVRRARAGAGLFFKAGPGVGTVTKPGLPIKPGEPAINPGPRQIIRDNLADLAEAHDAPMDLEVTISIPGGEAIAEKTWNPRLGIAGGLSVLGTTGIVRPFSCSAWIHSIHRGVDVARATGLTHIAGSTGSRSEDAVRAHYGLGDQALIDMGDFVGGLLKYARRHPVERITIAGGFAKMVKLAQGATDLHSARSQVDFGLLAQMVGTLGGDAALCAQVEAANTAAEVLDLCQALPLPALVARRARETALATLGGGRLDTMVVDRAGAILATSGAAGETGDDS